MKSILILTTLLIINTLMGFCVGVRIDFHISGLSQKPLILAHYYGNRQIIDDTIKLDNQGKGVYENKQNRLSGGIYLCILPNNKFFELLINNEQYFSVITDTSNIIENLIIEGASETSAFLKYQLYNKKINFQIKANRDSLKSTTTINSAAIKTRIQLSELSIEKYSDSISNVYPNSFISSYFSALKEPKIGNTGIIIDKPSFTAKYQFLKNNYWATVNFTDNRLLKTRLLYEKCEFYFNKLLSQQSDTLIPAIDAFINKTKVNEEFYRFALGYLINNYKSVKNNEIEKVYIYIAENYYLNGQASWADKRYIELLREKIATLSPIAIGKKAPNIVLETIKGKEVSLNEIEANWLAIYFWSPDCNVCKTETPLLEKIAKTYKSKGLKIMAVYVHADKQIWEQYIELNNNDWLHVYDPLLKTNFTKLYQVQNTPQLYLLDKNKIIVAKKINTAQLNTYLLNK